jgi:ABC-type sugar transport system substrate-binding protein
VSASDAQGIVPVIQQANAAGIPVISACSLISSGSVAGVTFAVIRFLDPSRVRLYPLERPPHP